MKKIILQQLILRNFKGVLDLTVSFGYATHIMGANESGKSTILSAFYWLLTGKDEFDRKDFEIKNSQKKELNCQAHEVEGIFQIDAQEVKLKRVYLEKWITPKGQSTKVFDGHTTEYYYNDVTCSASEYQAKVDEMIPAALIKLVTNPTYFNSLKWDDQRRGLIGIAGEISNKDILSAIRTPQNDFGNLIEIVESKRYKSLDEYKKELAAKKLLLKKKSTEYAPRIDEAKRNKPETLNWAVIEKEIGEKKAAIQSIDDLISDSTKALQQKQKGITDLRNQVFEKENKIEQIRNLIKTEVQAKQTDNSGNISALQNHIRSMNDNISRLEADIKRREDSIKSYKQDVERLEGLIAENRSSWEKINSEKFTFDESSCTCPTCLQELPYGQIEQRRAELQKNFNESVAKRKADEVRKSEQNKAEKVAQQQSLIAAQKSVEELMAEVETEKHKLTALVDKLSHLQEEDKNKAIIDIDAAVVVLLENNTDALNLQDEITKLREQIKYATDALGTISNHEEEKANKSQLQAELDELKKSLAVKETIEKTDARIAQLESEEQANAQEIATLEQQEFEVETYTRAKMDILEKKVNSMFRYVSFRLFEKQVNGAIAETCVCEYKGVPYPTLNTAAKLLAGLDVLDTLSRHYQIYAPVFCDNRESVTFIPELQSQIISLFVSPADTTLRVVAA